jgi:PAT family beta-lactamase induction signal transducer AmpG
LNPLLRALGPYRDPRLLAILVMGFASGLPLALTGATLAVWMRQAGLSLTAIGLFALVGIAYNVKFLWAPLLDGLSPPGPTRGLGRRKGWTLILQGALALAVLALGLADPARAPLATALAAVVVAFLSASQDVVIDAFRVELLEEREQGAGAAATQVGYRVGMVASGAGALYTAEFWGWTTAYTVMAGLLLPAMAVVWLTPEPGRGTPAAPPAQGIAWLREAFVDPFLDFTRRSRWPAVLLFVVLYKLGDALAGVMTSAFYVDLGFSRIEIANVSKIFGVLATILGVLLGGAVVYRLGVLRALLLCGVLQMLSNLMFAAQALVGHSVPMLMLTIGTENLTGGMGSAAFVAYLSSLCSPAYTATQYALLSSLAAVARTTLAAAGGALAEASGWAVFFVLSTGAAVPGLALLAWLMGAPSRPPRA